NGWRGRGATARKLRMAFPGSFDFSFDTSDLFFALSIERRLIRQFGRGGIGRAAGSFARLFEGLFPQLGAAIKFGWRCADARAFGARHHGAKKIARLAFLFGVQTGRAGLRRSGFVISLLVGRGCWLLV